MMKGKLTRKRDKLCLTLATCLMRLWLMTKKNGKKYKQKQPLLNSDPKTSSPSLEQAREREREREREGDRRRENGMLIS